MKIVVLNGSPKGNISVTMQYIYYTQKKFPQHEFKIYNISQQLKKIENNTEYFQEIIDEIKSSDGVLWALPLYYYLVHGNYKRFIELIRERGVEDAFKGKYTAALSTSIHFFDHTAHNYIRGICEDLDMKYVDFFSAEMRDLLKEANREKLTTFFDIFFHSIVDKVPTSKKYSPLKYEMIDYSPGEVRDKIDPGGKKVVILADYRDENSNLARMVERFKNSFTGNVEVYNLHDIDIKGGCLGCIHCGFDNKCVYEGKDGYIDFYNTKLKTADILVFGATIVNRYFSSTWKTFFDRSFFNTHMPSLLGKQFGFIISGPLRQVPDLREMFGSYVESQQSNLVDFISDEYDDSAEIDVLLENLAKNLIFFGEKNYFSPWTFPSVGGTKLFRDEMWGSLRFIFQADHRYYKKHGLYDFPQYDYKTRLFNLIFPPLLKIPGIRKEFQKHIEQGMVRSYKKIIDEA